MSFTHKSQRERERGVVRGGLKFAIINKDTLEVCIPSLSLSLSLCVYVCVCVCVCISLSVQPVVQGESDPCWAEG